MKRTHYCGEVNSVQLSQTISVCGWINSKRDHGGVIFIDLRDRSGLLQIVVNPSNTASFEHAELLRNESVIQVTGVVNPRPEGTVNAQIPSGEVELITEDLAVLNLAEALPYQIDESVSEEVRLRYRYLDLRSARMQHNLRFRHSVTQHVRQYLESHQFIDIETPLLTLSTPEGARDYLVPSRVHNGHFFALPQSPQLFKQLLMMSGFERYYQISRCFRDEDLRADRQPEFTQIDVETSFFEQSEIMALMEGMIQTLFELTQSIELGPLPQLTYAKCIQRFGTDRPDLRIQNLELTDVADLLTDVDFKIFAEPAKDPKCRIAALCVPKGNAITRKTIDAYTEFVGIYGAKGLAYIKVNDLSQGLDGLQSPIIKFLGEAALNIVNRLGAKSGDLVFFGADKSVVVNESLGALRIKIAQDLNLMDPGWAPLWVIDFPMFEDNNGTLNALHHPFTAPTLGIEAINALEDKTQLLSQAYDLVLNGTEIGGGSIRIHQPEMQRLIFNLIGLDQEAAEQKFGFLLKALQYGCPPHGGMAFGLDRLIMLLTGEDSIRNVIAFPKTQSSACPLTSAPGVIDHKQLRELGLKLK